MEPQETQLPSGVKAAIRAIRATRWSDAPRDASDRLANVTWLCSQLPGARVAGQPEAGLLVCSAQTHLSAAKYHADNGLSLEAQWRDEMEAQTQEWAEGFGNGEAAWLLCRPSIGVTLRTPKLGAVVDGRLPFEFAAFLASLRSGLDFAAKLVTHFVRGMRNMGLRKLAGKALDVEPMERSPLAERLSRDWTEWLEEFVELRDASTHRFAIRPRFGGHMVAEKPRGQTSFRGQCEVDLHVCIPPQSDGGALVYHVDDTWMVALQRQDSCPSSEDQPEARCQPGGVVPGAADPPESVLHSEYVVRTLERGLSLGQFLLVQVKEADGREIVLCRAE